MKNSQVSAFRAMTAAFNAAEKDVLGPNREWRSINTHQERLLAEVFPVMRGEDMNIPEIKRKVSWEHTVINDFLKEQGMSIELEQFDDDTFGFAAVMKIAVQWIKAGVETDITSPNQIIYPGVRIESEYSRDTKSYNLVFHQSPQVPEPVVTLHTKSGDLVHLTKFGQELGPFDLLDLSARLLEGAKEVRYFGGVCFPMVDLDVKPDVSWIIDMWTQLDSGRKAWISQAVQQCTLQMNHKGAVVKDAFAGAATLECMPPPNLEINGSFLFVLNRPGLKQPLFTAIIGTDDFKNPGELVF